MPTEESQVIDKGQRRHWGARSGGLGQAHGDAQINYGDPEPILMYPPTMYLSKWAQSS